MRTHRSTLVVSAPWLEARSRWLMLRATSSFHEHRTTLTLQLVYIMNIPDVLHATTAAASGAGGVGAVAHKVREITAGATHLVLVVGAKVVVLTCYQALGGVGGAVRAGDDGHLLNTFALLGLPDPVRKEGGETHDGIDRL